MDMDRLLNPETPKKIQIEIIDRIKEMAEVNGEIQRALGYYGLSFLRHGRWLPFPSL